MALIKSHSRAASSLGDTLINKLQGNVRYSKRRGSHVATVYDGKSKATTDWENIGLFVCRAITRMLMVVLI